MQLTVRDAGFSHSIVHDVDPPEIMVILSNCFLFVLALYGLDFMHIFHCSAYSMAGLYGSTVPVILPVLALR